MLKILLIAAGGGVGAVGRYVLSGWVQRLGNGSFPYGTLVVNGLGCLLIGLLTALLSGPYLLREEYRVAILVGLLGGMTTFSTFAWETITLAGDGQIWRAAVNVVTTNVAALAMAWLGYRVGLQWFGV